MFLSTSLHKIDRKGRVSVPAAFRSALEAGEGAQRAVALTPPLSPHACVEGCAPARIERLAAALAAMNPLAAETDDLAIAVLAQTRLAPLDPEGRIVLPEEAIALAGLTDRALFAGMGEKFQIWDPDAYEAHKAAAIARARNAVGLLPWSKPAGEG